MKRPFALLNFFIFFSVSYGAFSKVPVVYTSFPILNDVVEQIAPDSIQVQSLVPQDQDIHSYKVSAKDIVKLQTADLIIVWGLGLDQNISELTEKSKLQSKTIIATDKVPALHTKSHIHDKDHQHTDQDPHLWQSLERMQNVIQNIATAMKTKFPDHRIAIESATTQYLNRLVNLHSQYKSEFAKLPKEKKKVVTAHDAFAYLGKEMGIEIYSPQGLDSEQSPSLKSVQSLIKTIREKNIRVLFTENGQSSQLLDRVSRESGVSIKGALYSDSLSPSLGIKHYHELIEWNLKSLLQALKEGQP